MFLSSTMTPKIDSFVIPTSSSASSFTTAAAAAASTTRSARDNGSDSDESSSRNSSFNFGVIADVQWADAPDGSNYAKTVHRYYRGAFQVLETAVNWWRRYEGGVGESESEKDKSEVTDNRQEEEEEEGKQQQPLLFIAQLGDIIDGLNHGLGQSDSALQKALDVLDRAPCPSVNLVGNHELYNYNRQDLADASWLRHGNQEYYSFRPVPGWKVVVLDAYQIALIGYEHALDDPRRLEAVEIMARENPNVSPDGAAGDWFEGMENAGYRRRFVPYNGGYGRKQLEWFQQELSDAVAAQERVIILSHTILHPQACGGGTMAWDYEAALESIASTSVGTGGGCVAAVLCGHDHRGSYHYDEETSVHHCTFSSPLNKGSEGSAFGMIRVTPTSLEIRGPCIDDLLPDVNGRPSPVAVSNGPLLCESITLPLKAATTAAAVEEERVPAVGVVEPPKVALS